MLEILHSEKEESPKEKRKSYLEEYLEENKEYLNDFAREKQEMREMRNKQREEERKAKQGQQKTVIPNQGKNVSLVDFVVCLIFIAAVITGIVFMCRSCSAGAMESKVEEKAFGIVYLSTGKRASGFRADHTVISGNKAVCHFRYKINGEERISAIEFKIENGEPVPSGKFFVDEN